MEQLWRCGRAPGTWRSELWIPQHQPTPSSGRGGGNLPTGRRPLPPSWQGPGTVGEELRGRCGCLVLHGEASEAKSQAGLLDLRGTNQRRGGIWVWALGNLERDIRFHSFILFSISLLFPAALVSLESPGPGRIFPLQAAELSDPLQHCHSL